MALILFYTTVVDFKGFRVRETKHYINVIILYILYYVLI